MEKINICVSLLSDIGSYFARILTDDSETCTCSRNLNFEYSYKKCKMFQGNLC